MNIELIPDYVLDDLKERGLSTHQIESATPERLFDEYCSWHGMVGWGIGLATVLDDLRAANNKSEIRE